jgi:hypothetical protein
MGEEDMAIAAPSLYYGMSGIFFELAVENLAPRSFQRLLFALQQEY